MNNVYSARFFADTLTSTALKVLYTVPAGYVALVKSIDLVVGVTATSGVSLQLPGSLNFWFVALPSSATIYASWRGHCVLEPGETISGIIPGYTSGTAWLSASGYLLTLP